MRQKYQIAISRIKTLACKEYIFADQGALKTNSYTELMNKASCLSFLSNAIILHNTIEKQNIYKLLKSKNYPLKEEYMVRIPPLSSKHIVIDGIYNFYEE